MHRAGSSRSHHRKNVLRFPDAAKTSATKEAKTEPLKSIAEEENVNNVLDDQSPEGIALLELVADPPALWKRQRERFGLATDRCR